MLFEDIKKSVTGVWAWSGQLGNMKGQWDFLTKFPVHLFTNGLLLLVVSLNIISFPVDSKDQTRHQRLEDILEINPRHSVLKSEKGITFGC